MAGQDLIYARATGEAAAAIAVIRLSGHGAHAAVTALCGSLPEVRRAVVRTLRDPRSGDVIDQALVFVFATGASYTGEESAELHIHGGRATADKLFAALENCNARLAKPGEFTRRAVASGGLDLAEAEGVGAMIAAETAAQHAQALRALRGEVGVQASAWRERLLEITGLLETGVDFVDERLGDDLIRQAERGLAKLVAEFQAHIDDSRRFSLGSDRPVIALIGPPNAGKSSFLNTLSGYERAIVSAAPGTTRDTIEVTFRLGEREVTVVDTAGLRVSENVIEDEGVRRSEAEAARADLVVYVVSADTFHCFANLPRSPGPADALLWTKSDLADPPTPFWSEIVCPAKAMVSTRDPAAARSAFEQLLRMALPSQAGALSPLAGSERRLGVLERAQKAAISAQAAAKADRVELAVEGLREAANRLETLTGRIDHEDVLDALFGRFCIGK